MTSLKLHIEELHQVLQLSKSLMGDASSKVGGKSLGFVITEDKQEFFFLTSNVIRSSLKVIDFDLEGQDEWVFTLTPEDLTKLVESYKGLALTKVESIEFIKDGNFLNVKVTEVPANEEVPEGYGQVSEWRLNVSEPKPSDIKRASMAYPSTGTALVAPTRLGGYLRALLPLLSKSGTGAVSQVNFTEEFIFVKPTSITAEFRNQLVEGGTQDFTLTSAGAVSVLELVNMAMSDLVALNLEEGENPEDIDSVKLELGFHYPTKAQGTANAKPDYIAFRYNGVELFLRNSVTTQIRLGNSSNIFDTQVDENGNTFYPERQMGIVVDRRYYRNILRRLEATSDNVVMSFDVDNQEMVVETNRFTQKVPLLGMKGDLSGVKIAVSLRLLAKTVLGDDNTFTREHSNIFIYFSPSTNRGYRMGVMDPTGVWATLISVASKG